MVYAIKCFQPREQKVNVFLAPFNLSRFIFFKIAEIKKHAYQNAKGERGEKTTMKEKNKEQQ